MDGADGEGIPQGLKPGVVAERDAKAEALAYLEAKTQVAIYSSAAIST
jgi:hypothetical protein